MVKPTYGSKWLASYGNRSLARGYVASRGTSLDLSTPPVVPKPSDTQGMPVSGLNSPQGILNAPVYTPRRNPTIYPNPLAPHPPTLGFPAQQRNPLNEKVTAGTSGTLHMGSPGSRTPQDPTSSDAFQQPTHVQSAQRTRVPQSKTQPEAFQSREPATEALETHTHTREPSSRSKPRVVLPGGPGSPSRQDPRSRGEEVDKSKAPGPSRPQPLWGFDLHKGGPNPGKASTDAPVDDNQGKPVGLGGALDPVAPTRVEEKEKARETKPVKTLNEKMAGESAREDTKTPNGGPEKAVLKPQVTEPSPSVKVQNPDAKASVSEQPAKATDDSGTQNVAALSVQQSNVADATGVSKPPARGDSWLYAEVAKDTQGPSRFTEEVRQRSKTSERIPMPSDPRNTRKQPSVDLTATPATPTPETSEPGTSLTGQKSGRSTARTSPLELEPELRHTMTKPLTEAHSLCKGPKMEADAHPPPAKQDNRFTALAEVDDDRLESSGKELYCSLPTAPDKATKPEIENASQAATGAVGEGEGDQVQNKATKLEVEDASQAVTGAIDEGEAY